jgi:methionyl aminopeptidase
VFDDTRPITIHKPEDFEGMRKAGRLAAEVLDMIGPHVVPGVTTDQLNTLCHDMIVGAGAIPAPLGYRGFPKSVCTSVNHVVCHGIPGDLRLKEGDTVNIDVTVIVDGWHGDTSRMYWAGKPSIKYKRLCDVTYQAMMLGIAQVKPGNTVGHIGHAIETYANEHGYSVVEDYCGHGLGKVFHTAPNILHYGQPGEGPELKEGMFFTVEPMLNVGSHHTILSRHDGWTVTTRDKERSGQFEHSLGVTATGYEIFTQSPTGKHFPPYE